MFENNAGGQQVPAARYPSPLTPNGVEQRFRCLDLALRADCPAHEKVKLAGEFYDFVTGQDVAARVADALAKAD